VNKTAWVAVWIVGIIAVIVLLLVTGGDPLAATADQVGDAIVGEGDKPPADPGLADIKTTSVRREGNGDLVFEATMAQQIPSEGEEVLSFRWDVSENGTDTWMVTANFDNGPVAAVSALQSDYGASTIDSTLPGSIALTGDTVTITLEATDIEGFPSTFAWTVTSTLDADRAGPASATATDTAPDSGLGELE
jgi:hypothetical protein